MLAKDEELFYSHVARLLFTGKKIRPNKQAYVTSLFIRVELPLNYYNYIHLDIDLLFVNKIQMLLMISWNGIFMYFKTLLSKHNKYIKNKLQ